MTYISLCNEVIATARQAGKFLMDNINRVKSGDIETKGLHDYVSYVDRESEKLIVQQLSKLIPGCGFLAEENTVKQEDTEFTWIIDPLDGTTNYLHHVPLFTVSIALLHQNKLVLGVIYEPNLDECFSATVDSEAQLNGKPIQVSKASQLNESLLATGFPYYDYGKLKGYLDFLGWTMIHTRGVRRLGSAAADLAWVACGRFDAFYEYGLRPWDVAAGALIVQQAGGITSDFSGENNFLFGKEIIASNPNIFKELQSELFNHLK